MDAEQQVWVYLTLLDIEDIQPFKSFKYIFVKHLLTFYSISIKLIK